jgi:hypothetical protein
MSNPNFDSIASTTLKNYMPRLVDNIFTARPLFFFLKENNQVRLIDGAHKIVVPLVYGVNGSAGSYATYDTINVSNAQTDSISAAEYTWKQYAVSVAISGLEEKQNSGVEQIIDLLESKVMIAEETAAEKLDQMFFLDGTGNSGKDWLGLAAIVLASGTLGGIDGTANAYWRSYVDSTAAALTLAQMTTAYNTVSVGADQTNLIITTQALFEKYESLLQPQLRFTDTKMADGGFQNLLFKGAPLTYDGYTQSGVVYFLNGRYLRLVGHKDQWFESTPFVKPRDQDAKYAQILAYGELTCMNRSRLGKLTAKT